MGGTAGEREEVRERVCAVIEFLCCIADSVSAFKVHGNKEGGQLMLSFDDTQLPEVLKAVLLREQLLRVTIEATEDASEKKRV